MMTKKEPGGEKIRPMSVDYRLTAAKTFPEIFTDFDKLNADLTRHLRYNGKRLKGGYVINALILNLLEGKTWDEQLAYVREGLRRLEAHSRQEGDEPGPGGKVPRRDPETKVIGIPGSASAGPKRKKRG